MSCWDRKLIEWPYDMAHIRKSQIEFILISITFKAVVGSSSKLVRNSRTVDLDLGLLTVDLFDRFGRSMLTSGENRFSSWDCFLESDSVGVISRLNLVYQGSRDESSYQKIPIC